MNPVRKEGRPGRWTDQEVAALEEGLEKFGIGNWAAILRNYSHVFKPQRSSVDLKDKHRNELNRRIRHGLPTGPFG